MNTGTISVAVDQHLMRDLIELSFIEDYGWTPEYIASLPYKWIQKHNYMKKVKHAAQETRRQQQQAHQEMGRLQLKPGQKTFQNV